jgi:Type VI secretion system/phage-baseplate injector OB domain
MNADTSAKNGTYLGKYKAVVINNVDPMLIGRIQVIVPDVASLAPTTWAMPCVPVAGINMGMFAPPLIGSGVWVEFERGDPSKPIWVGCYWGLGAEVPILSHLVPPAVPGITLQTTLKNGIVISDTPGPTGGILIQTMTGAMVSVSDVGILISNGKGAVINMMGPSIQMIGTPIDMNAAALTVM